MSPPAPDHHHQRPTAPQSQQLATDRLPQMMMTASSSPPQKEEEVYLLRECIYAVQGMSDGTNILFYRQEEVVPNIVDDGGNGGGRLESVLHARSYHHSRPSVPNESSSSPEAAAAAAVTVPQQQQQQQFPPSNDMIMICGTMGMYVRYIQQFCQHTSPNYHHHRRPTTTTNSAIVRAFRSAVDLELQSYLQFITQMAFAPHYCTTTLEPQQPPPPPIASIQELIYYIYPYLLRFKHLILLIDSCHVQDDDDVGTISTTVKVGVHLLSYLYRHFQQHYHPTTTTTNRGTTTTTSCGRHLLPPPPLPPLVSSLLRSSLQPWLVMLHGWVMDGRIVAPEFFISTTTTTTMTVNDRYLWQSKYVMDTDRIPRIGVFHSIGKNDQYHHWNVPSQNSSSSRNLVDLIFIIGKGVNYIRQCLHDSSWSLLSQLPIDGNDDDQNTTTSSIPNMDMAAERTYSGRLMERMGFTYEAIVPEHATVTTSKFCTTLERSALLVHRHILSYLHSQFHLVQHLIVLKQFMLFGQGDFYTSFIESIYTEYPSKQHRTTGMIGVYRHTLSSIFESSFKSTNAVNLLPAHILERLDIDLLLEKDDDASYMFAPPKSIYKHEKSNDDSRSTNRNRRTIWNALVLKYTIPDPIVAIVHDDAMNMYRSIFVQLFRINHIEYRLHTTWRNSASIFRSLYKNAQYLAIQVNTNSDYQQAIQLLRTIAVSRQSMIHFISSLKGYIMSEVIECGWKRLAPSINSARTLDDVISSHDKYLENIMRQGFFLDSKFSNKVDQTVDHIQALLQLVEDFCELQEELFEDTFLAIERAEKKRQYAEQLAKQGSWGFQREREAAEQETCFGLSDKTQSIGFDSLSEQFHVRMTSLIQDLDVLLNGNHNNLGMQNGTATPSESIHVTVIANVDYMKEEEDIDFDALRFLASQLNFNVFYGGTTF